MKPVAFRLAVRSCALFAMALVAFPPQLAAQASFHAAPPSATAQQNPLSGAENLEAGRALYSKACAMCHGATGQGTGNIPGLASGPTQTAKPGELFWYITRGDKANGMPSWAGMSDESRWKIVLFLRNLNAAAAPPAPPAPHIASAQLQNAPAPKPPFTDFRYEAPGVTRKITVADLPQPFASESVGNGPQLVARPDGAWPRAKPGFKVELYAANLHNPRLIRTAPNGDVLVAESMPGRILLFRGIEPDGTPKLMSVFATGLNRPFGIAFYPPGPTPQWIYIGDTDAILRIPYTSGDVTARGEPEKIASLPNNGKGHWTRDLAFAPDGKTLYASVGSGSNVDDPDTHPDETNRAAILAFDPDGTHQRLFASGIRNAVGIAIHPTTGQLWCSTNERDALGDNLVPDYITHVEPGGFYGWPWWYIGAHQDPRLPGTHPELKDKAIVPDVLLHPHNASLQMTFYTGQQFPAEYANDIFASEHGSWNRSVRVGYEVIRVPLHQTGQASGEYEDFVTGFVLPDGNVWGRPVGVTVAADGSLLITDDGSGSIWRVSYTGKPGTN